MVNGPRLLEIRSRKFRMIYFRRETLLPARITWLGKGAADIAGDDAACIPQLPQCPSKIDNRKSAALPVCDRFFGAKTIKINRDVQISSGKIFDERCEMFPPVVTQNSAAALPIFH